MFESLVLLALGGVVVVVGSLVVLTALLLRRVVPTNEVHILQTKKKMVSYGAEKEAGNVYYLWPGWIPGIGVSRTVFPISIFDLSFNDYEAYDKDRVPFLVDIAAYFKIKNSNMAAQSVADFQELKEQLMYIVKGAVRTVLASEEIDSIMLERAKFGERFTLEVQEQLKSWGVESVKNIELMDVRDSSKSNVIHNIMAKRISGIEKDSRLTVAKNKQAAEQAEIEAQREIDLSEQDALQTVGQRTAQVDREVGIAKEQALQQIKEQQRETMAKEMAVRQVQDVRTAEIERDVRVVHADQTRQVAIIEAEGEKQQTVLVAEGELEETKRKAEGIKLEGAARADAERQMQEAPVHAQTMLAREIGSNNGYQQYLLGIEQIKAIQVVGEAQAKALVEAEVKVISTGGTPTEGLNGLMELFSPKGGQLLGAALEAFKNTTDGSITKQ